MRLSLPGIQQDWWLSICAVPLANKNTGEMVGTFPGKLLNNNCNVGYGGGGTEYHDFLFAYLTGPEGYWAAPNGKTQDVLSVSGLKGIKAPPPNTLPAYTKDNVTNLTVCRADFNRQEPQISFLGIDIDSHGVGHGVHSGYLQGNECHFEWGGREQTSTSSVEVYYLLPKPAPGKPPQPPVHNPNPPNPIAITGCTTNPQQVDLGGASTLLVVLNHPAPPPGIDVAVSENADGSADTLQEGILTNLHFTSGVSNFPQPLHTRSVLIPARKIVFSLRLGESSCSTELDIQ
jgi:hypothetical protein